MSKFFFHLNNSHGWTPDEEGQEMDGAASAMEQAFAEVRGLIAADVLNVQPIKLSSYVAVHAEGDNEIGRVRYDEAVSFE